MALNDFGGDSALTDARFMRLALDEARQAAARGEVPVGAIVVRDHQVIARGHNRREELQSVLAHAEPLVIEEASRRLGRWRLAGCQLYVTLEPCVMCVGAVVQARMDRLIFGCLDPKGGAVESLYQLCDDDRLNHRLPVVGGVLAEDCSKVLGDFFSRLREKKRQRSDAERWPSPAEGA
ncbi:MAG: tRNA adenosine(34) deaminase TadA [Candidatus Binatia bacterium]